MVSGLARDGAIAEIDVEDGILAEEDCGRRRVATDGVEFLSGDADGGPGREGVDGSDGATEIDRETDLRDGRSSSVGITTDHPNNAVSSTSSVGSCCSGTVVSASVAEPSNEPE